jgi:hypothetical protein
MVADFSGYATRAGLKCSDGRTIMPDAFKHMDGKKVPLVWQHGHNDPANVLGHAVLEARQDGVYAHAFFNGTEAAQSAKTLVQHGDITALSIYANKLVEKSKQVFHGFIREVSLVLSGANPGALIDNVTLQHADGELEEREDEAIIYTGLTLEHGDGSDEDADEDDSDEDIEHADDDDLTIQEVYDAFDETEKNVVHYMIGAALEAAGTSAEHSDDDEDSINHKEGNDMTRNVFEQQGGSSAEGHVLSHEDVQGIVADATKRGSLKEAVEDYALQHGIENIEVLFPDAKAISDRPEFNKRRTEWVAGVLNGTRHTPFSRIKSLTADLTHDEARAKGYIKGTMKKEEFFSVSKRTTSPTTIYKKQKLDRDDIVDITDFDVVAWLKMEMRMMLEEEIARAILIGDGRDVSDEDKIKDPAGAVDGAGIRSIVNDHELYATTVNVNLNDTDSDYYEVVEAVLRARRFFKGSGTPAFYTTEETLTEMLLSKDNFGRRRYKGVDELAAELRVSSVVPVEVMEDETDLIGIVVNLQDYNIGADKGGEVNLFDDFDIDYNQHKYLIETRVSGALVKIKSALVIKRVAGTDVLVDPITAPTFNEDTNVVTIPAQTGVVYYNKETDAVLTAGAQAALADGDSLVVEARPAAGYYFSTNAEDEWTFTNELG